MQKNVSSSNEGSKKSLSKKNNSYLSSTQDMPADFKLKEDSGTFEYEMMSSMQEAEAFSGPLPSPKILKGYSEIVPDAPERIIRMAEKQVQHDMQKEKIKSTPLIRGLDNSNPLII